MRQPGRNTLARTRQRLRDHAAGLTPAVRGLLWAAASGAIFCVLNALMRGLCGHVGGMLAGGSPIHM